MKKLLIATIMSLFVIGVTVSSYAATLSLSTEVTVNVGGYAAWNFAPVDSTIRSAGTIIFEPVDGSKASGWYYNALAGLHTVTGDPIDFKSDVGLKVQTNYPFEIYIAKNIDSLDGKLGYFVNASSAFNWDGSDSVPVVGEVPGTGFAGTITWGTIPSGSTVQIYDSGAVGYPDFTLGISFALVPGSMVPTGYSTDILYTLVNSL